MYFSISNALTSIDFTLSPAEKHICSKIHYSYLYEFRLRTTLSLNRIIIVRDLVKVLGHKIHKGAGNQTLEEYE